MSFGDLESGRVLLFNGGGRTREFSVTPQGENENKYNNNKEEEELSSREIVGGVFKINTAVASFLRLVNSIGTPKDTIHFRHKLFVPLFTPYVSLCFCLLLFLPFIFLLHFFERNLFS